eukprot:2409770-Amphidinium_carterae.1
MPCSISHGVSGPSHRSRMRCLRTECVCSAAHQRSALFLPLTGLGQRQALLRELHPQGVTPCGQLFRWLNFVIIEQKVWDAILYLSRMSQQPH